jgi:hypothetical protein
MKGTEQSMVDSGAHPPKMAACWNKVQYWGKRHHMHGCKPSNWLSLQKNEEKHFGKEEHPNLHAVKAEERSCLLYVVVNIR